MQHHHQNHYIIMTHRIRRNSYLPNVSYCKPYELSSEIVNNEAIQLCLGKSLGPLRF